MASTLRMASGVTSLSLEQVRAKLEAANKKAPQAQFDAAPIAVAIGEHGQLTAEARVFSSGGLGWYGRTSMKLDGVPVQVQVTITIPGTKPSKEK